MDMREQDGIGLIHKVIANENLWKAYEKVRSNKGAPGVDGMTIYQLKSHMEKYFQPLKQKLMDGTYQPQPVKRLPFQNQTVPKDIWESLVYWIEWYNKPFFKSLNQS